MNSDRGIDKSRCVPLESTTWLADFCLQYDLPLDEFQQGNCSETAPLPATSNDDAYDSLFQTCISSSVSSTEKGFIAQDFITKFSFCTPHELSKFSSSHPEPVPSEVISFEKPCSSGDQSLATSIKPMNLPCIVGPLPSPVTSKRRGLVRELSDSSLDALSVASVSDMVIPLFDDLPFDTGLDASFRDDYVDNIPLLCRSSTVEHTAKQEGNLKVTELQPHQDQEDVVLSTPSAASASPMIRVLSSTSLDDLSLASVGDMVTPFVEEWGNPSILDSLSDALLVTPPDEAKHLPLTKRGDSSTETHNDDTARIGREAERENSQSLTTEQPSGTLEVKTNLTTTRTSTPAESDSASLVVTDSEDVLERPKCDIFRNENRLHSPRNKKEPENKRYFEVTNRDVIFGRGTGPNIHNQRFRDEVVALYRDRYRKRTNNDAQKRAIIREIMNSVRNEGGRFLAKDKIGWFEVTPKAASVKLQKMTNEYKTPLERAKTSLKRREK